MTYDDSDIHSKTSGFGIGELGSIPASTPADDLAAIELMATAVRTGGGKFQVSYWQTDHYDADAVPATEFSDMSAALDFLRALPDGWAASVHASGYSAGGLYNTVAPAARRIQWRERVRLAIPEWGCDECGSGDVRNGRCAVCDERDMLTYHTHGYITHDEIRHHSGLWLREGLVVSAEKFVYDSEYGATGPIESLKFDNHWERWVFRVGDQWFNVDDVDVRLPEAK